MAPWAPRTAPISEWKAPYPRTVADVSAALGREAVAAGCPLLWPLRPCEPPRPRAQLRHLRARPRDRPHRQENSALPAARRRQQGNGARPEGEDAGGAGRHRLAHPGLGQVPDLALARPQASPRSRADNPTLLIVTDRQDSTSRSPRRSSLRLPQPRPGRERARSARPASPDRAGKAILTTVQKFQELEAPRAEATKPRRSTRSFDRRNIFVMADEAHRTQYGRLAAQPAGGAAERVLLRLHRHADRQEGRSTIRTSAR